VPLSLLPRSLECNVQYAWREPTHERDLYDCDNLYDSIARRLESSCSITSLNLYYFRVSTQTEVHFLCAKFSGVLDLTLPVAEPISMSLLSQLVQGMPKLQTIRGPFSIDFTETPLKLLQSVSSSITSLHLSCPFTSMPQTYLPHMKHLRIATWIPLQSVGWATACFPNLESLEVGYRSQLNSSIWSPELRDQFPPSLQVFHSECTCHFNTLEILLQRLEDIKVEVEIDMELDLANLAHLKIFHIVSYKQLSVCVQGCHYLKDLAIQCKVVGKNTISGCKSLQNLKILLVPPRLQEALESTVHLASVSDCAGLTETIVGVSGSYPQAYSIHFKKCQQLIDVDIYKNNPELDVSVIVEDGNADMNLKTVMQKYSMPPIIIWEL